MTLNRDSIMPGLPKQFSEAHIGSVPCQFCTRTGAVLISPPVDLNTSTSLPIFLILHLSQKLLPNSLSNEVQQSSMFFKAQSRFLQT
jgi:hypothetical protein